MLTHGFTREVQSEISPVLSALHVMAVVLATLENVPWFSVVSVV
jgi:hypothetical protein